MDSSENLTVKNESENHNVEAYFVQFMIKKSCRTYKECLLYYKNFAKGILITKK